MVPFAIIAAGAVLAYLILPEKEAPAKVVDPKVKVVRRTITKTIRKRAPTAPKPKEKSDADKGGTD